jgi:opacity protein-like surface antigen
MYVTKCMTGKFKGNSQMLSAQRTLVPAMALALTLMARPGSAQDFGPFVGGSVGTTRYDICDQLFAAGASSCDDQSTGFKVFGGYAFNRYLAVEGGYVDFGKMYAYSTGPGVTTDVLVNAYYLSGMAAIPLAGRASLFAKIGGQFWEGEINGATPTASAQATDNGTGLMYGAGASFDMSGNVGLRGEWERYDVDGNDVDMVSVGIVLMF